MSLTKLTSPPNLSVWLPLDQVIVSANWLRRSSGYEARSRNSGMPKERPLVMKVCGERPLTELVGSPGRAGWLSWNSKSRPYW